MKQSKFSLADVLTALTALAFGFVCFLGTNFSTLGETSRSLIHSLVIFGLLSGTALGAKLFKRTNRNFKTYFILEILMLVLFTGFMIFIAYAPFHHYFVVSGQKLEIQKKLRTSITQSENMFSKYEVYAKNREDLYRNKLQSVASSKRINPGEYSKYGFVTSVLTDDFQINNKIFTLHSDLFPSNYIDTLGHKGIKDVATAWLKKANNTTNSWKPIGIVSVAMDVEQNSKNWLSHLVSLSNKSQPGENAPAFKYPLSFDDVKTEFTKIGKQTPLSIGLAFVSSLLMLLSWFVTSRSTKSPGATEIMKQFFNPSSRDKGKYDVPL